MTNSITVCMTWGGKVEIYVNGELVDVLSPSHRCWSKYIGEYGGMVAPGSQITINAIPDEGWEFEKYYVEYFPIPDGYTIEVTENPWSFTLVDREQSIEVCFKKVTRKVVIVRANVKSVGVPPTTITATLDGDTVGEKNVDSPGVYEIGRVEVEPGTYTVKATAVDSAGCVATAEKTFNV